MESSVFRPGLEPPRPPGSGDLLWVVRGTEVVVRREGKAISLAPFEELAPLAGEAHFLGMLGERLCFAANLDDAMTPAPPLGLASARALIGAVGEAEFLVAGRAIAIGEWDRTHRFCGRCGAPTTPRAGERARHCAACALSFYPRLSPAVIVLIEREDSILLARNASFPGRWFSTLAGFVEPGESLEETVRREVAEEVGVKLGALRYFGSQPWPFGRSLMVGFNAEYAGGEIQVDGKEIVEAAFFRPDALPDLPPRLSIARQLIDAWLARKAAR